MKTKILQKSKHIILSSIFCIAVAFTATAGSYTLTDDDVVVENGVITSCSYNFAIKDIIIPETLDGQTVTGIEYPEISYMGVFSEKGITSLHLPSTIDSIGDYSFSGNYLTKLDVSSCTALTTIGEFAFVNNKLPTLNLSSCAALTSIGSGAFMNNEITSLDLSACAALTSIGSDALRNNEITSLGLSACTSLMSIGSGAFMNNEITSLDLSACTCLTTIGKFAFINNKLRTLNLSGCSSLICIGKEAFSENKLTSLKLPVNTHYSSFGWKDLNNNSYAGSDIVSDFQTLYYIPAPYTLTNDDVVVENGVIISCSYNFKLKVIIIPEILDGQTVTGIDDGKSYSYGGVFAEKEIISVTLPSTISNIGEYEFYSNYISTLNLDDLTALKSIGRNAFGTNYIKTLNLGEFLALTSIGKHAFLYNNIETVNFNGCSGLTSIGEYAFSANNIEAINFNGCSALTSIGEYAFSSNNLEAINFSGCSALTSIGKRAFSNNNIETINFSGCSALTSIGSYAFSYHSNKTIDLSNCLALKNIEKYAFRVNNVMAKPKLILPELNEFTNNFWKDGNGKIYSGGDEVSDLTVRYYISFPYTLTDDDVVVENGVITSCSYNFAIKDIIIPETLDGQTVIGIADGTIDHNPWIGEYTYHGVFFNKGITSIKLPSTIEKIGSVAFFANSIYKLNLSGLTALKSIGEFAFYYCNLSTLELSDCTALTYIGDNAFSENSLEKFNLPENKQHTNYIWINNKGKTYVGGDEVSNFVLDYYLKEYFVVKFYDWDETELKSVNVISGNDATAPDAPVHEGYTFTGWDTTLTNITQNCNVTAQYEISTYKIIFKDWNDLVMKTEIIKYDSTAIPPADPVREGYTFTGWDTTFTNITESYDVTAEYEINTYEITFKDWDDLVMKTDTVEYGSDATPPADPVRESYTFTGWDTTFTNITESYDVTAEYEISTYVITFLDWDGTGLKTETIEYGSDATAPADPVREGYTFTGWDTTFTNITGSYDITAEYEIKSSVTKTMNSVLELYPNPTKGMLYVSGKAGWQIQLFTLSGQRLQQIVMNNKNTQLNLSEYPEGTYILKVGNDSEQVVRKVVKK